MRYYKDKKDGFYILSDGVEAIEDLIEISKDEYYLLNPSVLYIPTKQELLYSIIVTTSTGKSFDGDETARNNIVCALTIAGFTGQISTNWKLADNSTQLVTLDELKEALALSLTEVGKIIGAIT